MSKLARAKNSAALTCIRAAETIAAIAPELHVVPATRTARRNSGSGQGLDNSSAGFREGFAENERLRFGSRRCDPHRLGEVTIPGAHNEVENVAPGLAAMAVENFLYRFNGE